MVPEGFSADQTKRATDRYEAIARSLFQIRGFADPGSSKIAPIVQSALAGASKEELGSPDGISAAAIGRLDQLVTSAMEVDRPRNAHSAEAARLEALGAHGAASLLGHKGFAEMQRARAEARMDGRGGDRDAGGSADRSSSGARYDSMASTDWSSASGMATTRSYATANNMSWATKEPDLMRMGKPALQALHEARLQGDGYNALRDPTGLRFDNKTIVAGAGYMKAVHGNYNKAAKSVAAVDKAEKDPGLRKEHKEAVHDLLHSDKDNRKDRQQRFYDVGEKQKKADPKIAPKVEEERRQLHVEAAKNPALKVEAAKSEAKVEAKVDQMAELMKKRQAAAAAAKPS